MVVDLADADPVDLLRRKPRLESLLGYAVRPRPRAVIAAVRAPRAEELTVYVGGDAGIPGARPELIGGYQPLYGCVQKADLRHRQIPEGGCGLAHGDAVELSTMW